jgi:hypothetical protein
MGYFMACQYLEYIALNDTMAEKLEKIWEEVVIA